MWVENSNVLATSVSEYDEQISLHKPIERFPQPSSVSRSRFLEYLRKFLAVLILSTVDYNAVLLGLYTAVWTCLLVTPGPFLRRFFVEANYEFFYFLIPFFYIGMICYEKLYQRRLSFWKCTGKLLRITTFGTLFMVGILHLTDTSQSLSRIFVGVAWLCINFYLITCHYVAKRFLVACGLWRQPVVVIGAKDSIELLASSFQHNPDLGYQIAGIIINNGEQTAKHSYPVIGTLNNLEEAIVQSGVSEVVIALPKLKLPELTKLIHQVKPLVKNVAIMPDLQGLPLNNLEIDFSFYQKMVLLRVRNNLLDVHNLLLKRIFDLIFGLAVLLISGPVMLIIAVLIKLDSPGSIIHAAARLGKNGRKFKCYKFRTMYVEGDKLLHQFLANNREAAEEWQEYAKLRAFDPRVTRMGKWLRRLSLDELPQIFTVLKGDMSLVGPRPYLLREQKQMSDYKDIICETMPGITGLWQVRGRNEISFEGRLSLDAWYVRNWSLALDLILLMKTVKVVLRRRGAC